MPEEKLALIIPAAGSGKRLGTDLPKPYLEINEKTILQHTLEKFVDVDGLSEVVISTTDEFLEQTSQIVLEVFPKIKTDVVLGGSERQDSILNAIKVLSDQVGYVAVHDAVRPFVETGLIKTCFQKSKKYGAAILALPVKDTMKISDTAGFVADTPDRSVLWHAQTPQIFEIHLMKKAYKNALEHGLSGTDDSYLIELVGGKVFLVKGKSKNFKITYPLDLELAKLLLKNTDS